MLAGAICIWLILKAYQAIKPSYWQGSYYPNGDTLIDLSSPVFRTKEQCLEWALQLKEREIILMMILNVGKIAYGRKVDWFLFVMKQLIN